MFLLTAFTAVATIVLAYILASLIKAGEAKLANQNKKLVMDVWFLDNIDNIPEETLDLLIV